MTLEYKKLNKLFQNAKRIDVSTDSKLVFMSDIHRGDGSHADSFMHNQEVYSAALSHYFNQGFTYIEIGDGDELWENRNPIGIISAHKDIFNILAEFYRQNRLVMLFGNHDIVKSDPGYVKKYFSSYIDFSARRPVYLFGDLPVYEALVLESNDSSIFILHGHQTDFLNSSLWRLARFLVRYLWRPLQIFGVNDPTSSAKNYKKRDETERKLIRWIGNKKLIMIAGHTHRPVFSRPGFTNYFNDGSAVHPRCITAIELENGKIRLVKWLIKAKRDGTLYVGKDIIDGPEQLYKYFWSAR